MFIKCFGEICPILSVPNATTFKSNKFDPLAIILGIKKKEEEQSKPF